MKDIQPHNSSSSQSQQQTIDQKLASVVENINGSKEIANDPKEDSQPLTHIEDLGLEKSDEESFYSSKVAADHGHADAQLKVAYAYGKGLGTTQSYENALYYFQLAAKQNIPGSDSPSTLAKFDLGVYYEIGYGVEKSYEKAFYYYRMAADEGNVDAQNNLGIAYKKGEGVTQSYQKAIECYRLAIEQNIPGAASW